MFAARDLPQVVPVFPLSGAILLPHASRPFNIFEPRYLNMIDDAMAAERIVGLVQPAPGSSGSPERPILAHVGCAGRITAFSETGDGRNGVRPGTVGHDRDAAAGDRKSVV